MAVCCHTVSRDQPGDYGGTGNSSSFSASSSAKMAELMATGHAVLAAAPLLWLVAARPVCQEKSEVADIDH